MPNYRRDPRFIGTGYFVVNLLKCHRNLPDCLRFACGAMLRDCALRVLRVLLKREFPGDIPIGCRKQRRPQSLRAETHANKPNRAMLAH